MDRGRVWRLARPLKWEQSAGSEALKTQNHPQHGSANEVSRFPAVGMGIWSRGRLALPQGSTATVRDAVFISSGCSFSFSDGGSHSVCAALRKGALDRRRPRRHPLSRTVAFSVLIGRRTFPTLQEDGGRAELRCFWTASAGKGGARQVAVARICSSLRRSEPQPAHCVWISRFDPAKRAAAFGAPPRPYPRPWAWRVFASEARVRCNCSGGAASRRSRALPINCVVHHAQPCSRHRRANARLAPIRHRSSLERHFGA